MNRLFLFLGSLAFVGLLLSIEPVQACPNCQEAIASSANANGDPSREPRAYNHSIYLMAGMPYLLLGFLGFKIYQNVRKSNANMQQMIEALDEPDTEIPNPKSQTNPKS